MKYGAEPVNCYLSETKLSQAPKYFDLGETLHRSRAGGSEKPKSKEPWVGVVVCVEDEKNCPAVKLNTVKGRTVFSSSSYAQCFSLVFSDHHQNVHLANEKIYVALNF